MSFLFPNASSLLSSLPSLHLRHQKLSNQGLVCHAQTQSSCPFKCIVHQFSAIYFHSAVNDMDMTNLKHYTRGIEYLENVVTEHENHITCTYDDQEEVEQHILEQYRIFAEKTHNNFPEVPTLNREKHILFLRKGLTKLSDSYEALDASRPWLCYWILHGLNLLGYNLTDEEKRQISYFLSKCQDNVEGGFGGGPGQISHLAATYAALNALACLASDSALSIVNRDLLRKFVTSMKVKDGSFRMHRGGEVDVRSVYCAVVIAKLTDMGSPDLFRDTSDWILSCQTYEGGFGGYPGMEAHGGYTFCAIACLTLLGHEKRINHRSLLRWLSCRQMSLEGGFSGRTNKLVDGCYSFWQGASCALLCSIDSFLTHTKKWIFDENALKEYLLICCQHPLGGLIDKPGRQRDYYHTCYALSGLSVAQHWRGVIKNTEGESESNSLKPVDAVYNLTINSTETICTYFKNKSGNGVTNDNPSHVQYSL